MKVKILCRLFLIISLLYSCAAFSNNFPNIPFPDHAHVQVVAEDMNLNGVNLQTFKVVSELDKRNFIKFYEGKWKSLDENVPGVIQDEFGDWTILSRLEKGYMLTIQIDNTKKLRVEALATVSNLPSIDSLPSRGRGFPKYEGMVVENDIVSKDLNKTSRTIIARTDKNFNSVVSYYRRYFIREGWTLQGDKSVFQDENSQVFLFEKSKRELSISIARQGQGTGLVAVFTDY